MNLDIISNKYGYLGASRCFILLAWKYPRAEGTDTEFSILMLSIP